MATSQNPAGTSAIPSATGVAPIAGVAKGATPSKSEALGALAKTSANGQGGMNNQGRNNLLGSIAIEASTIIQRLSDMTATPQTPTSPTPNTTFLPPAPISQDAILSSLSTLIRGGQTHAPDEDAEENWIGGGSPLDEISRLVLASHATAAYCGSLDRAVVKRCSVGFGVDCTRWLNQIFSYIDLSAFFHHDPLEGIVRITRMHLHRRYPRYADDGAMAFVQAPPTLYASAAGPLAVVQHLCRYLGLPLACVRAVPVNTHFGCQHTMDVSALQQMMSDDANQGRTPIIVLADCGTPITGHLDNIPRLKELCKGYDCWLHLRGHNLAALALPQHGAAQGQQNGLQPPSIADSFTLPLGSWLGIPGLPMITLYQHPSPANSQTNLSTSSANAGDNPSSTPAPTPRQVGPREGALPLLAGLTHDHLGSRSTAHPLWIALQCLGSDGVHLRIRDNFLASERLFAAVDCYRHVRVLSQKPGGENGSCTVSELISKPVNIGMLFETTASSVVFQFIPELQEDQILKAVPPYYDKLNSWLGQILQIEAPQLPIEICELENVGIVLRYSPFENTIGLPPVGAEEVKQFVQCLEQQLIILRATVQHKETFIRLANHSPVLEIVQLPEWAGLGGVRYKPDSWESLLLNDQARDELNQLNIALVDSLRATDSAFSLGEGPDGLMCVRFGMLTPQSDVEELLSLVVRVGQSVEENSRVLDSMSEIVKKGIETATLDLQKENEERLWQEGILRHVPVVGTFVNWWSPKQKESGVRGRSLNLTQGVVESTENIYKYHMQMQSGQLTGSKQPPTPQIQTQISSDSQLQHSRSSSHASTQSGSLNNALNLSLNQQSTSVQNNQPQVLTGGNTTVLNNLATTKLDGTVNHVTPVVAQSNSVGTSTSSTQQGSDVIATTQAGNHVAKEEGKRKMKEGAEQQVGKKSVEAAV